MINILYPSVRIANRQLLIGIVVFLLLPFQMVFAQHADIDVNTPSILVIKKSLGQRFIALKPHLDSGVIGVTADGLIAVRDLNAIATALRAGLEALVADENQDRGSLYREIARANGRPDWESNLKQIFGERFISRAQPGWYYLDGANKWNRKP